ncbi:WD repeat-containing protein 49 isoform 3 [Gossypium australe]|uniref:WD repeat-containing protein 49 isoform 3 n=1 Tax=Gossypium australe TaxID=47621 RepID=A0A5B6WC12_9ROSI|nr:WD repeat-containing protein 49 isoform 3 [Gossypium australe]
MRVSIGSYNTPLSFVTPICSRPSGGGLISISSPSHSPPALRLSSFPGLRFCGGRKISVGARAGVNGASETTSFEPYLEEMDVVTFLDPPNYLIPLDPGKKLKTYQRKDVIDCCNYLIRGYFSSLV